MLISRTGRWRCSASSYDSGRMTLADGSPFPIWSYNLVTPTGLWRLRVDAAKTGALAAMAETRAKEATVAESDCLSRFDCKHGCYGKVFFFDMG